MKAIFLIFAVIIVQPLSGQTLGGSAAYNFLRLPTSAMQNAAGGLNVSYKTDDAGYSMYNPALLDRELHGQVSTSYLSIAGTVNNYSAAGVLHSVKLNTTFGAHIIFFDYGATPATDAAGNQSGTFRPSDFSIHLSASRQYINRWQLGGTAKIISSIYGQYRSSAIAFDVGVHYASSDSLFNAGVLAKNMGIQLKSYAGESEELPFDLQAGITKRLAKAPLAFSFTAHHLHRFNITYNDDQFNTDNGFNSNNNLFNNLFNHFVFSTHLFLGKQLEATIGYNHLRRTELVIPDAANGLTGFSAGLRLKFDKLQVIYARSAYQNGIALNHFGLNLWLNKTGLLQ